MTRHPTNRLLLLLVIFAIISLFLYLVIPNSKRRVITKGSRLGRASDALTKDGINLRIEDLQRIKSSLKLELISIESDRKRLLKDNIALTGKLEKLNIQISRGKSELRQLELDINANKRLRFEKSCNVNQLTPLIFKPLSVSNYEPKYDYNHEKQTSGYRFNFSRCPLTDEFKFSAKLSRGRDPLMRNVRELLTSHRSYTPEAEKACLIVVLLESNLTHLDRGHNNLILDLNPSRSDDNQPDIYERYRAEAAFAFTSHSNTNVKKTSHLDIQLPRVWKSSNEFDRIFNALPPQSPIERRYLASYFGHNLRNHDQLEETLQIIHKNSFDDLFLFSYNCDSATAIECHPDREAIVEASVFLIIFPSSNIDEDIYLALSKGAIPVFIERNHLKLPFHEVIDWRLSSLIIPTPRLPEIHFILRSIDQSDIYRLKYYGRKIFVDYLATAKQIIDTLINLVSLEKFSYPPPPVIDHATKAHNKNYDLALDRNCTQISCIEERANSLTSLVSIDILGPRESPFASRKFRRNMSLALIDNYKLWNDPMHTPIQLYPSHPHDPIPPSEYKFLSQEQGYRPINNGLGGSGFEFSRALGGDYPDEQFTVVILTYQRQALLMKTLERLKGMAFLNKILVVWNDNQKSPPMDLIWPDVGVPIVLVKVFSNSLNNRFLPYDVIETDAIFSMDDDSPLRPDEIVFAFRVWRQSRDRIVGFPGRYHAWDMNQWMYNSNHSCELTMVLTGGAFFHKFYTYLYTYDMPQAIRSLVDKFMNCEDIAMNFLVAHLTRKPPIKVTSRWTFHCAGCTSSLSEDDSHFRERHECLNTFAAIYGYMPLLTTQHRSDSILFKTRLPEGKQKCFKFV